MQTIRKNFRVTVTKADEQTGLVDMLIPLSTGSMDRAEEVIEPQAWKKTIPAFMKRPVLLSSHKSEDLRRQIGEFIKLEVAEYGLYGQPRYYINEGNPEADWAFKLASRGMAAFSVGFLPIAWEDGKYDEPARTYKEVELLEISQVVIPANRDAIQGMKRDTDSPVIKSLCSDILNSTVPDDAIERFKKEMHGVFVEYELGQIDNAFDNAISRFKSNK